MRFFLLRRLWGLVVVGLACGLPAVQAEEYSPGDQVVVIRDGELRVEKKKVADVWPGLTLNRTGQRPDQIA